MGSAPSYEVHVADAFKWLPDHLGQIPAIATQLPDAYEMGWEIPQWQDWFRRALDACFEAVNSGGPVVFCHTDRMWGGMWLSKAGMMLMAAERAEFTLLWHKVATRRDVGQVDLHRPTYRHIMAFSEVAKPGRRTPDVIYEGPVIYPDAMGIYAAQLMVAQCAAANADAVVDPFCGRGTILHAAREAGLKAVGVDIDPDQAALAEQLLVAGG